MQKLLEQQIAEQKSLMVSLDSASTDEKKNIMARLRKLGEEMTPVKSSPPTLDPAQLEKERLDKELEMHASTDPPSHGESAEDLKAKLEKLKAEVGLFPSWFVLVTVI